MEYVFANRKSVEVAVAAYHATNANVITTDHDFAAGDIITYVHSGDSSEQIVGLESGRTYRVDAASLQLNIFTLCDIDGS